jgi:hypothetical protein
MHMSHTRSTLNTLALLAAAAGGWLLPTTARAEDPKQIMEKVAQTRKLDGSEAQIKMTLIDEKGQKREREINAATKLFDGGKTEKRVFRFTAPADVQGTGYLVFDYETKADDAWVFLPEMRKTRRIMSNQGGQAFMSSEFNNSDINFRSLDDFNFTLVKEDTVAGEACFVVDTVPKTKEIVDAEGYSKRTWWVSKSKYVPMQIHLFDKDGKLVKEMKASEVKLLDAKKKRYRTLRNEMINKVNGRRSVFEFKNMIFAPNTKDEYFTTAYIERG